MARDVPRGEPQSTHKVVNYRHPTLRPELLICTYTTEASMDEISPTICSTYTTLLWKISSLFVSMDELNMALTTQQLFHIVLKESD